ncbi:hypothetical protein VMCG_03952 [Cytospora schulzeri]|uniref:cellulase n=1 Tax=Cytospora schulzeri TaxID=448051 RepID=A0A423WVD0_9PEZI|nr:hypothetical protein VMCG_03952 [Valsa malicola]
MIIQSTNTAGGVGANQFDLLIPGGGIGEFQNGCLRQFGITFPGDPQGGVDSRPDCGELPTQRLRDGCYWRFDWFHGANNPHVNFTQVRCPSELIAKSGCMRSDDSNFPLYTDYQGYEQINFQGYEQINFQGYEQIVCQDHE